MAAIMNSEHLRSTIRENAHELSRLHALIHETVRHRDEGNSQYAEWSKACAEFNARYDTLAFPGGYDGALELISSGDALTIETGLCFLECRPYFFRSGYMYKDILRRLKRAPVSESQRVRLQIIVDKLATWKAARNNSNPSKAWAYDRRDIVS
jgi:hypothetical protein